MRKLDHRVDKENVWHDLSFVPFQKSCRNLRTMSRKEGKDPGLSSLKGPKEQALSHSPQEGNRPDPAITETSPGYRAHQLKTKDFSLLRTDQAVIEEDIHLTQRLQTVPKSHSWIPVHAKSLLWTDELLDWPRH